MKSYYYWGSLSPLTSSLLLFFVYSFPGRNCKLVKSCNWCWASYLPQSLLLPCWSGVMTEKRIIHHETNPRSRKMYQQSDRKNHQHINNILRAWQHSTCAQKPQSHSPSNMGAFCSFMNIYKWMHFCIIFGCQKKNLKFLFEAHRKLFN